MTILVPIDPSRPSRAAVQVAALLARVLDDELLLLHVSTSPPPLDRLAELHAIAEPLRGEGVPVRLRTAQGDVVERVHAFSHGARWVVMGTRGTTLGARARGDSVAWRVLSASPAPVVAVRPSDVGVGAPLRDGPLLLVSPEEGAPAHALAAALSRATGQPTRRVQPALRGPGLFTGKVPPMGQPLGGAIIAFDPDCVAQVWCERVVATLPEPVLLVGGGPCACEAAPRAVG
jgi:nucleotide-binding universal stress UspA family protein